jgi:hypothetical protein
MIYSQALVAFVVDGVIWHKIPGVLSLVGCLFILVGLAVITLLNNSNSDLPQNKPDYSDKLEVEELRPISGRFGVYE